MIVRFASDWIGLVNDYQINIGFANLIGNPLEQEWHQIADGLALE